jgi:hypothetical protein
MDRQGYAREDLHDAWMRYLPLCVSPSPLETVTSVTSVAADTEESPPVDGYRPLTDDEFPDIGGVRQ